MEISGMRCSLYEAAVPQRASEPSKPRPYGEMVWKVDIDLLQGPNILEVPSLVELAWFKNPGIQVLEIGPIYGEALLDKLPNLNLTVSEKTAQLTDLLGPKLGEFKNAKTQKIDLALGLETQSIKEGSFNLVIAFLDSSKDLISIRKLLTIGGRAILECSKYEANLSRHS